MATLLLKRFSPRKWKLLVLTSLLAALATWSQFKAYRSGIYTDEMLSRESGNHGSAESNFDASIDTADFAKVKVMALVGKEESSRRRSIVEKGSADFTSRLGEIYMDSLGNAKLNRLGIMNITQLGTGQRLKSGSENGKFKLMNESMAIDKFVRRTRGRTVTFSEMNSMLIKAQASSRSLKRRLSARERELLAAKTKIKVADVYSSYTRTTPELHSSLFRNVSMFQRSYESMERTLKVYIYKEGDRPIFHQPKLRGLYCSEGWFMKLLERNRCFVTKDPRKAHLFYLPFSSELLRVTIYQEDKSPSLKKLEMYLSKYVALIRRKYNYWNRTDGADHFLVGCHDWALRITGQHMSNCIRALCNTNVARGFNIGKDVSIPATYIRSGDNPSQDIGGNPPTQRPVLAFFAGGIHGYLRPLLLEYWGNKTADMKVFGPMQHDSEGKAVYRRYMKQSKYCICARGYEGYSPRVVESIYYECVPVFISDNYVPPFFEVLDWEAFSVSVLEKDVPYLREILISIPEERYLEMQRRVTVVRRHFIWHKIPEKYDLFHMMLHSIWFNRLSQI